MSMNLCIEGEYVTIEKETSLKELAKNHQSKKKDDIVLAFVNNHLCELHRTIEKPVEIQFVTTGEKIGNDTYRRSVTLLMLKAFADVLKAEGMENEKIYVMHSVSRGLYCEFAKEKVILTQTLLEKVKKQMEDLVEQDLPIEKYTYTIPEAMEYFAETGMKERGKLLKYRRVSNANIYRIGDYEDYFYGFMAPSTGYLKYFDLILYEEGFVLQMPIYQNPTKIPDFIPYKKLFHVLKQSEQWGKMLEVDMVSSLNDVIVKGSIGDLMLVQEALQEKNIADIASQIVREKKQLILIAGPSSSGKTSFSHRLSIQLRALGLKPHPIALDNYFVNRENTPKDENGAYNFECMEAVDAATFRQNVMDLLAGDEVLMPTFNFLLGKREYKGDTLKIGTEDVLVIEGIHGLNPLMTHSLPEESKFKIYISALTQLNVDEHNRISTTDGRLIRRIIRDARTRGNSAQRTISMWNSVRKGEEENIFPYQEEADIMFNSALIYELCVLKPYIEPLLFAIPKEAPEYMEAKRLLKFLDYFLGVGSENIPTNSILREFVGGSCFHV